LNNLNSELPADIVECKLNEFPSKFEEILSPSIVFERLGEAYEDLDIELFGEIEDYLDKALGTENFFTSWHQSDFSGGDGVRLVSFVDNVLKVEHVKKFLELLEGDYSEFAILCNVYEDFEEGELVGSLGVFSKLVLTSNTNVFCTKKHGKPGRLGLLNPNNDD